LEQQLDHVQLGDIQQEYSSDLIEQIDTELVARPKFSFSPDAKPFVPSHDTVANHKVETIEASFDPAVVANDEDTVELIEPSGVSRATVVAFEEEKLERDPVNSTHDEVESNSVPSDGDPTINTEADSSNLTVYQSYLTS
jgi:hypothetical protein